MQSKPLLLSLLLLGVVTAVKAVAPVFRQTHFATELPQNHVLAIVQDQNDYIYLATRNGLCRYDGCSFRNFKSYPGDSCSLSTNRIDRLWVSPANYIWCMTHHDRYCYLFDPAQERFFDPLAGQTAPDGTLPSVEWIYPLKNGITWIACRGCAFRIEEGAFNKNFENIRGGVKRYTIGDQGIKGDRVEKIRLDSEQNEWIVTDQSVFVLGEKKQTMQQGASFISLTDEAVWVIEHHGRLSRYARGEEYPTTTYMPASCGTARNLKLIGRDTLGIATHTGIAIYYAAQERFDYIPIEGGLVNQLFCDRSRRLWAFTEATGIFCYDLRTGEKRWLRTADEHFATGDKGSMIFWFENSDGTVFITPHEGSLGYYNPETKQLEPLRSVTGEAYRRVTRRYFVDRQQNLWLAESIGVSHLSFQPQNYRHINLQGAEIRALHEDRQGRLWVASRDRTIRLFDRRMQLLGYLGTDGALHKHPVTFTAPIYCIHEDDDGTLFLGSRYNGLFRLTKRDDDNYRVVQFNHNANDSTSLSASSVYAICRDRHGRLWIGTYDGGLNLMTNERSDRPIFIHAGNRLPYPRRSFLQIRALEEIDGHLLIGTTNGLAAVSTDFGRPEEAIFHTYQMDIKETDGLLSNDIRDIHRTSSGETYLLAFSGGLCRLIPEKCTTERLCCENLTCKDGLPSEQVLAMIEEPKSGRQWIITEQGTCLFDPAQKRFDTFGEQYRSNDAFFSEAKPLLHEQYLLIGTTNGLCTMPVTPEISRFIPPIRLTSIRINDEVHAFGLDTLRHLQLESDQRNLQLSFSALDYSDPEAIRYSYRFCHGSQKGEWRHIDRQRTLKFLDLDAGDFTIDIRSTNSDGLWVDNTYRLQLTVAPTFWETRWVWLLYFALVLLAILIPVVILHLRSKIKMEQQLSDTKLRFYSNISHELRTPLTLITAPIDHLLHHEQLTAQGRNELGIVRRNTQRLIHTINQILDFRKIENHKMRILLEQGDLQAVIRSTMSHFDLLAADHHINYRLECGEEPLLGWFDRDKLEKTLFNLLSNAFKYTPDGRCITVRVAPVEDRVRIEVIDEGVGIDESMRKRLFVQFETLMRANLFKASSGIGLSLVHELITLLGGRIEVDSEVGRGSRFTVILPIRQNDFASLPHADFLLEDQPDSDRQAPCLLPIEPVTPSHATPSAEAGAGKQNAERLRILLVEDNDELRQMLRDILATDYTVYEAADGIEGLSVAHKKQPDMVISDVIMPRMDGLELVRALKSDANTSHISILILSAKSSLEDRIQGLEQGVDDYIPKPFHATYLLARIRSLVARRHELQQQLLSQMVASDMTQSDTDEYVSPEVLFLRRATAVVEAHLDNSEWTIEAFASALCLSHTVLYQKLKAVVGLSPVEFIREVRLKKAGQLIREGHYNIATISYMVGFSDPKYFTRVFKKRFGLPPSQYNGTAAERLSQGKSDTVEHTDSAAPTEPTA